MTKMEVHAKLVALVDGQHMGIHINPETLPKAKEIKSSSIFKLYYLSNVDFKKTVTKHKDASKILMNLLKAMKLKTSFSKKEEMCDKANSSLAAFLIENLMLDDYGYAFDLTELICRLKVTDLESLLKRLPDEKKFRRLFFESMDDGWKMMKNGQAWEKALLLLSEKVNKDIVFNHLQKLVKSNETLLPFSNMSWQESGDWYDVFDFGISDNYEDMTEEERKVYRTVPFEMKKSDFEDIFSILKDHYTEDRICDLVFNGVMNEGVIEDIVDSWKSALGMEMDISKLIVKQPKTFHEIHDFLIERMNEEEIIANKENFDLNQREDFLKLDNTKIQVLDQTMVVKVPKTRHDLAVFSRKSMFDNCVGTGDGYAEQVKAGRCSIVGVFDEKNKPLYCIQTSKYSFLQATGVSNARIPKEVFAALEQAITVKPELPADFIPVNHSFIFGYSYNPKNECLYLMFRKTEYIYEYTGVESDVYEEFAKTSYKGQMLNSVIKKYPCHRLNSAPKKKAS